MGAFLAFAERKDRGAGAGDGKPERSRAHGGALGFVEIRDEFLAARFGDHVVDRAGDQAIVFLDDATEQPAEVADLLGGVFQRDLLGQDFPGDFCQDFDIGMDHGRPQVLGGGELGDVEFDVRTDENDAA